MNTTKRYCAFSGDMEWASNMYEASIVFDPNINDLGLIFPMFEFDGLEYGSSEHLYQSLKTTNWDEKEIVRTAATPKLSKKYGSKVFYRMDWDSVKVEAMRLSLYLKFYHHANLIDKLLETKKEPIIEINWWNDKFWGVCCRTNEGENWLGRLLMELRSNINLMWRIEVD